MRLKKALSLLMAMVMVVALMPTTAMATVSTGNGNPQLTKKAEWVDQESGLAKITLQAKGTPIVTPKKGADVVVVMDYSGSMEDVISSETFTCNEKVTWTYSYSDWWFWYHYDVYTGTCPNGHRYEAEVDHGDIPAPKTCNKTWTVEKTRWEASKNALDTLLNEIIPTTESSNQVAVVAFDSKVRNGYTNDFTNDKGSISTTINNLSDPHEGNGKGTNYDKALKKVKDYINNRSDKSRDAYVVFLSDGEPDRGSEGTGEMQAIKNQGTTVYTIGLALNSSDAIDRLETYASQPEFFKNISTASDLDGLFRDIGETIASEVTIWDTIDTEYFSVTKKPGENISYEASKGAVQFTNDKDFAWNIENFSESGETLEIYIQLKAEYLNTNAYYPTNAQDSAYGQYVGEEGTNVPLYVTENDVSSAVPQLATAAVPTYLVTGTIDNGGTVTNGSQPDVSTSLDMEFTANPGYHIASITKNGVPQPLTGITTSYVYPGGAVTENVTVNVTTAENSNVTITYTATEGGSVNPPSQGVAPATGSATGSVATPNPGFQFVNWTIGSTGVEAGGNPTLTKAQVDAVAKNSDGIYVATEFIANFVENGDVTINYVAVGGGSVNKPSEALTQSTSETLKPSTGNVKGATATANKGHEFIGWATTDTATTVAHCISTNPHYVPSKVGGVYQAATYYAIFAEKNVTITYVAGDGGSVSPEFEQVKAKNGKAKGSTATADAGYVFDNWTDANGTVVGDDALFVPSKTSGVFEAATYRANFVEDEKVTISYTAGIGGSVSSQSEEVSPVTGDPIGSTATASAGYVFNNWTDANGTVVEEDALFVPSKTSGVFAAATYTANFVEDEKVTISYTAGIGGSVSAESEEVAPVTGKPVGSTAKADAGYHFVSWKTADQTEVGADPLLVPTKNGEETYKAITYYASFAEDAYVTINYVAGNGGSVSDSSDTVNPAIGNPNGSTATANAGYVFNNWTDANGTVVGEDALFVPSKISGVFAAATYTANFVEDEKVTISYTAGIGGSVSAESEEVAPVTGEPIGSTAKADAGYHFVSWKTADQTEVGADPLLVPTKNGEETYKAITYYASFAEDAYVTINYVAGNGGSVSDSSDTVNPAIGNPNGSTATANAGYVFNNWTDANGTVVGEDALFVPSKTSGVFATATYTANFVEDEKATISYTAGIGGSVSPDSEEVAPVTGDPMGSTATASTGYVFNSWTDANGTVVGEDALFVPSKTSGVFAAATYTANFVEDEKVTISYTAGIGGSVSPDSEEVAPVTGDPMGSTATASAGYVFNSWTDADGNEVGTDKAFVPQQNANGVYTEATYTANFVEEAYVTVEYIAGTGGTISDIATGAAVSRTTEDIAPATGTPKGTTADRLTGYDFVNWTNSQGVEVGTSYEFKPTQTQGVFIADTYTANFKPKYHNFVVEDIYQNLMGEEIDDLHSVTGKDSSLAFNSEISSVKDEYLRGYEYSDMIVYVDEVEYEDAGLSELGITVDRISGTLTGNLPDNQIWVKYIYNEVEKYDVTYTSEGKVAGMPEPITDAIAGDEIIISTAIPVRDGFDFLGWIPEINGDTIEVTDGKFIMQGGDVEIRASWKANEEVWNYDVKYYTEDGNLITTIPSTVLKRDPVVTTVEDKTPEGYKLQGYTFNGGEMTPELSAEITEDGQTIAVYYVKNDLTVKHVYGSTTVYDSNQSKANLSAEDGEIIVNAVTSGRYTRIVSASLNNESLGRVSTVKVVPDGEGKYEVVFTYKTKSSSDSDDDNTYNPGTSDSTPGEEVTIIEDPAVALQDGLETIDHYAYVFGYEDGTVRPENKVTREEVATIFYRLLTDGTRDALFTREQDFPDVQKSRWSNVAIATLLNGNIVSGYPDSEFKPGNYITRAEFAAIVAKFDNLSYSGDSQFNDINGHWAANYINSAALKGWINGYPDGSFQPDAYITRAEAITLINAVLGRQVDEDGLLPEAKYWSDNTADKWYYEAIMEATNSHDYEGESESDVETWTSITEDKIWTER
ncbi:MAG: S-layer homology domain-containing protein [Anaerotignaceae bacterium]